MRLGLGFFARMLIGCGIFEISLKAAEINKHAKQSQRGQNGVTAVSGECNVSLSSRAQSQRAKAAGNC